MDSLTEEAFVLRTNASGDVIGLNPRAERICGNEALGVPCNQIVRGKGSDGSTICREGCAQELASGQLPPPAAREAVMRGRKVSLRCYRVGDEAVVFATPVATHGPTEKLTPREREVLALVAQGMSSVKVAAALGISHATVRTHIEHARGRLGAKTRAEAVLRAVQTGQLSAD